MCAEFTASAMNQSYEVERLHGKPIIEGATMRSLGIVAKTSRGDAMFPTVVRVPDWVPDDQKPNPRANYYLYFAAHHGTCISLAWAEKVDSSKWTLFNVGGGMKNDGGAQGDHIPGRGVLDLDLGASEGKIDFGNGAVLRGHVSSPEVLVDDENRLFIMIVHGGSRKGQRTFVATSEYGLNFNLPEEGGEPGHGLRPFILNSSNYMRVFRHASGLYAIGHSGYLSRPVNQQAPWSLPAGHSPADPTWEQLTPSPFVIALEKQWGRPLDGSRNAMRHCSARVINDGQTLEVFYSRDSDVPERILRATVDISPDNWIQWSVTSKPEVLLEAEEPWEGECLHDTYVFTDAGGQLYLFYSCREEDAIAVAKLNPISRP